MCNCCFKSQCSLAGFKGTLFTWFKDIHAAKHKINIKVKFKNKDLELKKSNRKEKERKRKRKKESSDIMAYSSQVWISHGYLGQACIGRELDP